MSLCCFAMCCIPCHPLLPLFWLLDMRGEPVQILTMVAHWGSSALRPSCVKQARTADSMSESAVRASPTPQLLLLPLRSPPMPAAGDAAV